MKNFEKPLQDFTDTELLEKINQRDPKFGILASYELLRRLISENSSSSKRYARWSLIIAIIAIVISLFIGGIQIYLGKIQIDPIRSERQQLERHIFKYCSGGNNSEYGYPDDFGRIIPCNEWVEILKDRIER